MVPKKRENTLSPKEITSICDAAKAAWNKAGSRTKKVKFTWRGKTYQSTLTTFRMLVETPQGNPVAARWH